MINVKKVVPKIKSLKKHVFNKNENNFVYKIYYAH